MTGRDRIYKFESTLALVRIAARVKPLIAASFDCFTDEWPKTGLSSLAHYRQLTFSACLALEMCIGLDAAIETAIINPSRLFGGYLRRGSVTGDFADIASRQSVVYPVCSSLICLLFKLRWPP